MVGREEPSVNRKLPCVRERITLSKTSYPLFFSSSHLSAPTPLLPHSFSQFPFFIYSSSTPLFFLPRFGSPTSLCSPLFLFLSPFSSRLSPSVCFYFSFFILHSPLFLVYSLIKSPPLPLRHGKVGVWGTLCPPLFFFLIFLFIFIFLTIFHFFSFFCSFIFYFS